MDDKHQFTLSGQGLTEQRIQVAPSQTLRDVIEQYAGSASGRQGGERTTPRRVRISYDVREQDWNKPFSELTSGNGVIELL